MRSSVNSFQIIRSGSVDGAKIVAERIEHCTGISIAERPRVSGRMLVHGVYSLRSLLAILASPFAQVFVMPHGQLAEINIRRSWKKALFSGIFKFMLPSLNLIFLNRDEFEHSAVKSRKIENLHFIPNFVDDVSLGINQDYVVKPFDPSKKINLVFWGRLDVFHKGLDHLFEFTEKAFSEGRIEGLLVIGPRKDEASDKFLTKCSELLEDRFQHIDFVPQSEIASKIPDNSVFALFSRHEGMPLAGLEALRLGLPVIASRWTNLLTDFPEGIVDGSEHLDTYGIFEDLQKLRDPSRREKNIARVAEMRASFVSGFQGIFGVVS